MSKETPIGPFNDAEIVDDMAGFDSLDLTDNVECNLVGLDENTDIMAVKQRLLEKHYRNRDTLAKRILDCDGTSVEKSIDAILEEIAIESDNLLGNEIIFTNDNRLHDATTVSVKRAEVLETMVNVIKKKFQLMSQTNQVNLRSPIFQIFQQLCVEKLKETLVFLDVDDEMKQLIVLKWGDNMANWTQDVKDRSEHLNIKFN